MTPTDKPGPAMPSEEEIVVDILARALGRTAAAPNSTAPAPPRMMARAVLHDLCSHGLVLEKAKGQTS